MNVYFFRLRQIDLYGCYNIKNIEEVKKTNIANKYGEWERVCGNMAEKDGFSPCNENGEEVEPDANWSLFYVCDRCGRIYDNEGHFIKEA